MVQSFLAAESKTYDDEIGIRGFLMATMDIFIIPLIDSALVRLTPLSPNKKMNVRVLFIVYIL